MFSALLARLHLIRPRPAAAGPARVSLCPPLQATPLWAVRLEFMRALSGIRTQQAGELLDRIGRARSLRELWHLRADVFDLVSHCRDQAEANARLTLLNRHFPTEIKP